MIGWVESMIQTLYDNTVYSIESVAEVLSIPNLADTDADGYGSLPSFFVYPFQVIKTIIVESIS